jgi:hypothetical protein
MKTTVKFVATILLSTSLIFGACKKKKVTEEQDQEVSGDNTQMESEEAQYRDEEAGAGADCNFDWSQVTGTCATITQSSVDFPKVVTIDYGITGCTDAKGRLKKGKIIFSMSANIHTLGATRDVTFDGFSVNGKSITGARHAENIGENANGNIEIRVTGSINAVNAEGKTHSRTFNRVREWTAGYATCTHTDDEYSITGTGTCTNKNGVTKNWIITSPLIVKPGICNYIMSGVINIGTETRGAIINFGEGSCDNLATLLNKRTNVTYTINLDTHQIQ